jgi:hypothetical protein
LNQSIPEILKKDIVVTQKLIQFASEDNVYDEVALLNSLQILEKTLRFIYYDSYKYIFKIKFSILIDKCFQENKISETEYIIFKKLKNYRNHQLHLPQENPYLLDSKLDLAQMVYEKSLKLLNDFNI